MRGTTGRRAATPSLTDLADLVARWRLPGGTAELLAGVPRDVVALGYDRCLVSRVHDDRWIAHRSHVRGDDELADAITLAGSEVPAPLDRRLLESELVRTRAPILVRDAQRHPRVHRRLIDVSASTAYVAAPVLLDGVVVGFVHADRTGPAAPVDRELEVLERVAAGERNADIATRLFITHATVKAHVKHIFRKLGVANRAEAVSVYLQR